MDLGELLNAETVSHVGYRDAIVVAPDVPVRKIIEKMQSANVGGVLVCEGEQLVGMFTERDVVKQIVDGGTGLSGPVAAVMTRDPVRIRSDESVGAAIGRMQQGGFRRLPVVDAEGRPLGIISVKRVLKFLAEYFPTAVFNLPPRPDDYSAEREGA